MKDISFPVECFWIHDGQNITKRPSHKSSAGNSVAGLLWAMYKAFRRLGLYFFGEDASALLRISPAASSCSATADDLRRAKVTILASWMLFRPDIEGTEEFDDMFAWFQQLWRDKDAQDAALQRALPWMVARDGVCLD